MVIQNFFCQRTSSSYVFSLLKLVQDRMNVALAMLLAVAVVCIWARQIAASFWVDEMVTVFVVHHGGNDPSLAVAPQVPKSSYYKVAQAADTLFGTREPVYRIPSILFSLGMLWLIARLAARLIHPQAAWFAVFACFACKALNWEAPDARPYAMGFCAMAAAALFLIRWLDSGHWWEAVAFVILGALIWRIQLIFWPVYVALVLYAIVRLERGQTPVTWARAALVFGALGILLLPVLVEALAVNRHAGAHVIVDQPTYRQLLNALQWKMMLELAGGACLIGAIARWAKERTNPEFSAMVLAVAWWLAPPVALFVFSQATGNSVFVRRYYSIALPGAALAATCFTAYFLPKRHWKHAAIALAIGVIAWYGIEPEAWPGSNWRSAAAALNSLPSGTPVVAPSPFIEAKWPDWRPDYPLPGFLYAHLNVYPVKQRMLLFPFHTSEQAENYATGLIPALIESGRFAIYGGDSNVRFWRRWFLAHAAFSQWSARSLGSFGDVEAVLLERGQVQAKMSR
jgi:Dolichyl-phosphate-mannose-protein mannosyltransferase